MAIESDSGLFSSITEYSQKRKQIALSVAAEEESENPISIDVYACLSDWIMRKNIQKAFSIYAA